MPVIALRSLLLALGLLTLLGCTPALRMDGPLAAPPWQDGEGYIPGNQVELLPEGPDTYAAMYSAITGARHHIHVETYLFCDDAVGRQLSAHLIERSRAGVAVRLIFDSVGSHGCTGPRFLERLRAAGIEILVFHPPAPDGVLDPVHMNRRDHRKLLIVDGRTAFTGGINFNDVYAGSSFLSKQRNKPWRDTNLRVRGPAVAAFQALFLQRWRHQRAAPELPGNQFFPELPPVGPAAVRVVASEGGSRRVNPIYRSYLAAITGARERVWLTHAYLTPEPRLLAALTDAARRGVDVRLVLPGFSDAPPLRLMARSAYERLLSAGVKIYEHDQAYVHAKTAVVDGRWSSIGSLNLDYRSLLHNDEANAMILDRAFAQRMEALFRSDIAKAEEIRLQSWRKRPSLNRIMEQISLLGAFLL